MADNKLLSVAIIQTRDGELEGFENLFLLTYKDTYVDISATVKDEEYVWYILRDVYVQVYERSASMPEASLIRAWIRILIKDVTKTKGTILITEFPDKDEEAELDDKNIESKASTTLIKIEDQLGLIENDFDDPEYEKLGKNKSGAKPKKDHKAYAKSSFMVLLSIILTIIAVIIVIKVVNTLKNNAVIPSVEAIGIVTTTAEDVVVVTDSDDDETLGNKFGWNDTADGKKYKQSDGTYVTSDWLEIEGRLYYFDEHGYMVQGLLTIDAQTYIFSETGELLRINRSYEIETDDTILSQQMEQFGDSGQTDKIVDDSITVDDGWIYYLSQDTDVSDLPLLLRYKNGVGQMEMIADQVEGYVIVGDDIWYYGEDGLTSFNKAEEGIKVTDGYSIEKQGDGFYLKDGFGRNVTSDSGSVYIDGRQYRVSNGLIKYVKPGTQSVSGITWKLNDTMTDNKIYLSDGSVYLEQGLAINSFCIVNNNIYYSAIVSSDGSNVTSQIYRYNIDTGERIALTGQFYGAMLNMYYYKDTGNIYMEYTKQPLASSYGEIAVMTLGGDLSKINDSSVRSSGWGNGNDMMELIMVQNGTVYCYWNNCSGPTSTGVLQVYSTQAVELDDNDRTGF